MPRVRRTPPSTPNTANTDNARANSSPDISSAQQQSEADLLSTLSRNKSAKRLKPDSPESMSQTFEDKIMKILTTWKTEQNATLKSWKDEQDTMLKSLKSDSSESKQQYKEIKKITNDIENSLEFMNKEYENMRLLIQKLENERLQQRGYIIELEKKVEDLQRSHRSSIIEMRNVPRKDNESTSDLTAIVVKTCSTIQAEISLSDLRDVYRLPGKNETNRPIIVEFLTVSNKLKVLAATRAFNRSRELSEKLNTRNIGMPGQQTPIYIAEHLPNSMKKLYHDTRSFAKSNNYRFCWYQNGKIFLREKEGAKYINIRSNSDFPSVQSSP